MATKARVALGVNLTSAALGFGGWGASMSGDAYVLLGRMMMYAGGIGFIASLAWTFWPRTKASRLKVEFVTADSSEVNRVAGLEVGEIVSSVGLLLVHNVGPVAVTCRAGISVNRGVSEKLPPSALARWVAGDTSGQVLIRTGETRKVVVAILAAAPYSYRWSIPYRSAGGDSKSGWTEKFYGKERAQKRADVHVTVSIQSDQKSVAGPLHSFRIEGMEIHKDTGLA